MSGISFENVDVRKTDFTGSKGAVINPQYVYDKLLCKTKLTDVKIKGFLDEVDFQDADFTGVVVNPRNKLLIEELENIQNIKKVKEKKLIK